MPGSTAILHAGEGRTGKKMPPMSVETTLSTETVEDIQRALARGVNVAPFVAALRGASLAGILEYGCLRWALGQQIVPELPPSIMSNDLGEALAAVGSELGLRPHQQPKASPGDIAPRTCEFMTISRETDLESQTWNLFQARFNRSACFVGFADAAANSLQAGFHEMAENAVLHARTSVPALSGYRVFGGVAQFAVVDVGIGVLASLKSCRDYQHLRHHAEAIREALCDGTSRWGQGQGGFGFRQVFRSLQAYWGHLRFRSGEGCITMDGTDLRADRGRECFPPFLPGFQVAVTCQSESNILLPLDL